MVVGGGGVRRIFVAEIGGVAILLTPTFGNLGPRPSEENDSPLISKRD